MQCHVTNKRLLQAIPLPLACPLFGIPVTTTSTFVLRPFRLYKRCNPTITLMSFARHPVRKDSSLILFSASPRNIVRFHRLSFVIHSETSLFVHSIIDSDISPFRTYSHLPSPQYTFLSPSYTLIPRT